MNLKSFLLVISLLMGTQSFAQDQNPLVLSEDARYFDFWEGTWHLLKDDNTLDTTTVFKVKRSVHPAAFEEYGNGTIAIRAWDKTNSKWSFVWVSSNGLFQVWDTRKVDGHWYIYKEFTVNDDTYLSRQSFKLQKDGTVLRTSEKSYDDKTWTIRFQQRLKKVK